MKKHIFLFSLFLIQSLSAYSQKQANFWHFGYGVTFDFNSGVPFMLNNSQMFRVEGTATISDSNGQLQFYTDGIFVYNRNNQQMPDGYDLNGGSSTTQVLIVPAPGNQNLYYIFTLVEEGGNLYYSVVDMAEAQGLGNVVSKNMLLNTTMTEKVAGIFHCNNHDVWVMAHKLFTDEYVAYLVTDNGIGQTPVRSYTGSLHGTAHGQLKFSSDGKQLAAAIGGLGITDILDFNNVTGIVSNSRTLQFNQFPYGIEFSPDNSKLYVSDLMQQTDSISRLLQFDLNAPDVPLSRYLIDTTSNPNGFFGGIQKGPDGKIYVTNEYFLAVINNPDLPGTTCNYQRNALFLNPDDMGISSRFGLPNFIQNYFDPIFQPDAPCTDFSIDFTIDSATICPGECIRVDYTGSFVNNWKWTFSGADASITSGEDPGNICYPDSGIYSIRLIASNGIQSDTSSHTIHVFPGANVHAGEDQITLPGSAVTLEATGNLQSYTWNPPAGLSDPFVYNPTAAIDTTTTYSVSGSNSHGCHATDSLIITVSDVTAIEVAPGFCSEVFIPTAFSPDNNGTNDFECVIAGACISKIYFAIFNRLGERVFETTNPAICWDGKHLGVPLNTAEFVYRLNATTHSGTSITKEGTISLIR